MCFIVILVWNIIITDIAISIYIHHFGFVSDFVLATLQGICLVDFYGCIINHVQIVSSPTIIHNVMHVYSMH